jgi:vacuolar-type H+-ATPase subunit C/Vma6
MRAKGRQRIGAAPVRRDARFFLREEPRTGYPVEYLRSRVRGRRSRLIGNWRAVLHGSSPEQHLASAQYQGFVRERTLEGMWKALLSEHGWLFAQMDEELRTLIAPYFLYVELRTIFMCLRYREAEQEQEANELLEPSLLSREIKGLLRTDPVADAVAELEDFFRSLSPAFEGLAERYYEDRRRAERQLTDAYLGALLARPLQPELRSLFVRLIDARNILALYKAQRLESREAPAFLTGGSIAPERLRSALERDDPFAVLPLLRQATGLALNEPDLTRIETALYRAITTSLRREARDPLGPSLLIDYLWRCSLEITNLSLLFAGKDLEREEIGAELVY